MHFMTSIFGKEIGISSPFAMSICCSCGASATLSPSTAPSTSSSSSSSSSFLRWKGRSEAVAGVGWKKNKEIRLGRSRFAIKASMVDSQGTGSTSDFSKRMELAWMISQQPRPVMCTSCKSRGYIDCNWCRGTGFFIIGDKLLCQVPSRNTNCVICAGKGSACCSDCKGTGFRAKWLGEPPIKRSK